MDNTAFKQLALKNASAPPTPNPAGRPAPVLGSRLKSSIPMTPRSVSLSASRNDFARQLAEKNAEGKTRTEKKFRTSAPKGSRFAEGYVDRSKLRQQEEDDERAARLKALEKAFKDEEIDRETYESLRGEIAGGDLSSTHLVKGLDFKLLERVRNGEDVFGEGKGAKAPEQEQEEEQEEPVEKDPDDVLEELGAEVRPVEKQKVQKKGQFAPTSLVPGQKRSRNQILAELKAAREAAKQKTESALGSKFKKIGAKVPSEPVIERDSRGNEIMIITDEFGNERRKVRRINPKAAKEESREAFKPDEKGEVLGMEVPEFYKTQQLAELAKQKEEEEKEISIFDDAGSDYDPLAGLEGSEDGSGSEDEGEVEGTKLGTSTSRRESLEAQDRKAMPPPPKPNGAPARPNYFKDSKTGLISAESTQKRPDLSDPALLATLRKARALEMQAKTEEEIKAAEREAKLKKMLESSNRDDQDMDMGFGSSRVDDEADMDETEIKLSAWGADDDEDDDGKGGGGKAKRKRGGKKRKGDKDSFTDVMKVIESRKGKERA